MIHKKYRISNVSSLTRLKSIRKVLSFASNRTTEKAQHTLDSVSTPEIRRFLESIDIRTPQNLSSENSRLRSTQHYDLYNEYLAGGENSMALGGSNVRGKRTRSNRGKPSQSQLMADMLRALERLGGRAK